MPQECRHTLRNGQKCRGAATRNHDFCRHHGPKPALAGPPPTAQCDRYSRLGRWRSFARQLPWLPPDQIPLAVYEVLGALTGLNPVDRLSAPVAGRYLGVLLSRLGRIPFPQPGFAEPSAPPAPPPPARDPVADLSDFGCDIATVPPDLRKALENLYRNTCVETVEAFTEAVSRFDPASVRRPAAAPQLCNPGPSHR
jgi:hypothetical protein